MQRNYSFYLVIDHSVESAARVIQAVLLLASCDTIVHAEHLDGVSTFQIDTAEFLVAAKVKLAFGSFIRHEQCTEARNQSSRA